MGKDKNGGFLAPKSIANRIKAKGLQKLRWYCQMCNKQCRDENGFKCHCMSESHQRQMEMFSENSTQFMDEFSREFEEGMMEIIKRKARSQRQNANQLYRDYIADKQHFHMNATIWETLTDFVMYLGRKGMAEVDETEKGWFVTWIDRDPETLARNEARAKRERSELDEEERHQRDIERQVKAAKRSGEDETAEATELMRSSADEKIKLAGIGSALAAGGKAKLVRPSTTFGEEASEGGGSSRDGGGSSSGKKPMSSIEALMLEEKQRKERAEAKAAAEAAAAAEAVEAKAGGRQPNWLAEDIVVKVMNKRLNGGAYYKQKGVVEQVAGSYTAHVRMSASGDLIKLDQDDLETVIPAAGGRVLIVNGRGRGERGTLADLDESHFCVNVELASGRVLEGIEYEDVCKLAKH